MVSKFYIMEHPPLTLRNTLISFPFTNFNWHVSFCVLKSYTETFTAKCLRTTAAELGTTG
jgi:hypothetical protein